MLRSAAFPLSDFLVERSEAPRRPARRRTMSWGGPHLGGGFTPAIDQYPEEVRAASKGGRQMQGITYTVDPHPIIEELRIALVSECGKARLRFCSLNAPDSCYTFHSSLNSSGLPDRKRERRSACCFSTLERPPTRSSAGVLRRRFRAPGTAPAWQVVRSSPPEHHSDDLRILQVRTPPNLLPGCARWLYAPLCSTMKAR